MRHAPANPDRRSRILRRIFGAIVLLAMIFGLGIYFGDQLRAFLMPIFFVEVIHDRGPGQGHDHGYELRPLPWTTAGEESPDSP